MNWDLDILQIAPIIQDVKQTITFMRGRNLLLQDYFCCQLPCSKVMDISLKDKEIFQCKTCSKGTVSDKAHFGSNRAYV